jgi:hypothetical protein
MDSYRIDPAGTGFLVIEDLRDGRHNVVEGFSTESDAQGWLDSLPVLVGLRDCLSGKTARDRCA